jgi:hypothetical protein
MVPKGLSKPVRQALEALEAASSGPELVAAARELREAAEALEVSAVARLRADGGTWTQVGAVYGTSKQAAQQRFRAAVAELGEE